MLKKRRLIKLISLIIILGAVIAAIAILLNKYGITDIDKLQKIMNAAGVFSYLIFGILQILVTVLLAFIPGTSMTFIILGIIVFGPLKAAILCSFLVIISSFLMFLIGKFFGQKAVIWIVGKKDFEKAQVLADKKAKILLPVMFLFPFFPDDALCMVYGLSKMKKSLFLLIVVICRPVGVVSSALIYHFFGPNSNLFYMIGLNEFKLADWVSLIGMILILGFFLKRVVFAIKASLARKH